MEPTEVIKKLQAYINGEISQGELPTTEEIHEAVDKSARRKFYLGRMLKSSDRLNLPPYVIKKATEALS